MNIVGCFNASGVIFHATSPLRQFTGYWRAFDTSSEYWCGGESRGLAAGSYVNITSIALFFDMVI